MVGVSEAGRWAVGIASVLQPIGLALDVWVKGYLRLHCTAEEEDHA
jgi:hypothetical protein